MKTKKCLALILVAMMVLATAACSGGNKDIDTPDDAVNSPNISESDDTATSPEDSSVTEKSS